MIGLVVADTTVWSNFGQTGKLELVHTAFPNITSPPAVLEEIAAPEASGTSSAPPRFQP